MQVILGLVLAALVSCSAFAQTNTYQWVNPSDNSITTLELPSNWIFSAPPAHSSTGFVTGETTLGTLRTDGPTVGGFYILIGASPITVTDLGRWVVAGNAGQHVVSIYDSTCKPLGSATVNTSGAPSGSFAYAGLSAPVVLAAGQHYYVMSAEAAGGDRWYNDDTVLTTTAAASVVNAAWMSGGVCFLGGGYPLASGGPGHSYGFPSFKYQ